MFDLDGGGDGLFAEGRGTGFLIDANRQGFGHETRGDLEGV